jgi:hypothetical protein
MYFLLTQAVGRKHWTVTFKWQPFPKRHLGAKHEATGVIGARAPTEAVFGSRMSSFTASVNSLDHKQI